MPVNMKREVLEHEIRDFLSGLVFGQGEISDSQAVTNATKRLADNIERRYPIRSCEDFSNYATSSADARQEMRERELKRLIRLHSEVK